MFTVRDHADPTVIRLGFVGAGNMAAAMARGWASVGEEETSAGWVTRIESMTFADAGSGRSTDLAKEVGGEAVGHLGELAERSNAIVLAVKPAALDEVAAELNEALGDDVVLMMSVLAGVSVDRLNEAFPTQRPLRTMPNLPVEVRQGVICYVAPEVEPPGVLDAEGVDPRIGLLEPLGALVPLDEAMMDAATAVMSCSPAYIALVAEALAAAGADAGLSAPLAHELVVDSLAGTAELLRQREPEAIRRAVASPGGATEAGLEALAERDFEAAVHEAVRASLERMRR